MVDTLIQLQAYILLVVGILGAFYVMWRWIKGIFK